MECIFFENYTFICSEFQCYFIIGFWYCHQYALYVVYSWNIQNHKRAKYCWLLFLVGSIVTICHQEPKKSVIDVQFSKTNKATVSVPFSVNTISHHSRMKHITGWNVSLTICMCMYKQHAAENKQNHHKFHELFVNQLHPLQNQNTTNCFTMNNHRSL